MKLQLHAELPLDRRNEGEYWDFHRETIDLESVFVIVHIEYRYGYPSMKCDCPSRNQGDDMNYVHFRCQSQEERPTFHFDNKRQFFQSVIFCHIISNTNECWCTTNDSMLWTQVQYKLKTFDPY